jgi:hypothetical protein
MRKKAARRALFLEALSLSAGSVLRIFSLADSYPEVSAFLASSRSFCYQTDYGVTKSVLIRLRGSTDLGGSYMDWRLKLLHKKSL